MKNTRWRTARVGVAIAGLLLSGCAVSTPPPGPLPHLFADDSVAGDFAELAQVTWRQFLTVFRARAGCFGDVHLHAALDLNSRASYDAETATVTVRVPGTPAMLQSALIHEWAHHVEFQCPAQKEMRAAFLKAQELAPDTPWRSDNALANTPEVAWAGIPSEQYAEATIEVVLGERPIPTTARVSPEAVRVIAQWAAGK